MAILSVTDLAALEVSYLGVLSLGLVSAELARDDRFRMEYVCATAHALLHGLNAAAHLAPELGAYRATPAFVADLKAAIIGLDRKGVIGIGPSDELMMLKPSAPDPDAVYGEVDVNRHPPIFDRFLAQRCMDVLMDDDATHRFLIECYAESGEVWAELAKQGYGQFR